MEGNAITVKIGAETDQVEQGLKNIQSSLGRLEAAGEQAGSGFDASFGKIAGATAVGGLALKAFTGLVDGAFAAARATVQGFTDALDLGGRLADLSARTGETAGNVLLLERAFENAGAGADKVGPAINKLQKFMEDAGAGGKEQAATMNALGLSYSDLAGKTPTEQMQIFAQRISAIQDPTSRAAVAMDIFGKSGGELLPLLQNFGDEINTAKGQLGSMTGIMDRQSGVFDNVSDKLAVIGGKFMEFAAGILDKVTPALDAITEGLSRIDAAGIGQKLADAFVGGGNAMKGFQASVDAFKAGNIMDALNLIFESTKLQSMESANSILKHFSAAFQTVSDIISQIFRGDGPALLTITSAFDAVAGRIKASIAGGIADTVESLGPAFARMADGLRQAAEAGATSSELALQRIPVAAELAGEDISKILGGSTETFQKNLQSANGEFFNTQDQAAKVAALEADISKKIEEQKAGRQDANALTEAEGQKINANLEARRKQSELEAQGNAEKQASLENELAIAQAKASGNTELVKTLENQKLFNTELKKAIDAGMGEKEAKAFAQAMVNAKNAADGISGKNVEISVTTKVDSKALDDLMAKIRSGTASPQVIQIVCDVTGAKNLAEAEQKLANIKNADANKEVVFKTLGAESWQEAIEQLSGIPKTSTRELAMSLTKTDNFDQALQEIGLIPKTKDVEVAVKNAGFKDFDDFKKSLTATPSQKDIKVVCESLGVKDIEDAKNQIRDLIRFNNAQVKIETAANTAPAQEAINNISGGSVSTNVEADTTKAQEAINQIGGSNVEVVLDAAKSIASIREQLKQNIDLAFKGSEGTKYLGDIKNFVGDIKKYVEELNRKLPTPALI